MIKPLCGGEGGGVEGGGPGFHKQLSSDRFGLFGSSSLFAIEFEVLHCMINDYLKYNLLLLSIQKET